MVVQLVVSKAVGKVEYSVDSWDDEMVESMAVMKVEMMDDRVAAR